MGGAGRVLTVRPPPPCDEVTPVPTPQRSTAWGDRDVLWGSGAGVDDLSAFVFVPLPCVLTCFVALVVY